MTITLYSLDNLPFIVRYSIKQGKKLFSVHKNLSQGVITDSLKIFLFCSMNFKVTFFFR